MQSVQNVQKKMRVVVLACAGVCVGTIAWDNLRPTASPIVEYPRRTLSLHLSGQPGHLPCCGSGSPEGESAPRAGLRHEQGIGRTVRHDHAGQVVGHYYTLSIDGAVVADPATRTFFDPASTTAASRLPNRTATSTP